jgi:hypothetical protein
MNTSAIRAAEQVLHAAMQQGRVTAAGLAYALESAQLLQSPETAEEMRKLQAHAYSLESFAEQVTKHCAQRAEYVTNLRDCNPGADHDYYRWTGHAEARRQLSQLLGLPVGWPAEDCPAAPVSATHEGPEPHTYRLGRDLPEVPRG